MQTLRNLTIYIALFGIIHKMKNKKHDTNLLITYRCLFECWILYL